MNRPDDSPGPTIWAAQEVRRDVPTDGQVFWRLAVLVGLVCLGLVLLAGWALS